MDYHLRDTLNSIYFSNASRTDSITPLWSKEKLHNSFADNPVIDKMLADGKIKLKYGDRAFYNPNNQTITIPSKERFPNADQYYFVLFHELTHAVSYENETKTSEEYEKIAQSYNIPKGSTFLDVIGNIATKFDNSELLSEAEKRLYVANIREELLTDVAARDMLQRAGYKITPAIKENVNATVAIAKELSKDLKQDFVTELYKSKSAYNGDLLSVVSEMNRQLNASQKELGVTSTIKSKDKGAYEIQPKRE